MGHTTAVREGVAVPSAEFWARFARLRVDTLDAIRMELEMDGHRKSTEGEFSVVFPDYLQLLDGRPEWGICLYCYVLGPSRQYGWTGKTPDAALDGAEKEIRSWLDETREEYAKMFPNDALPTNSGGAT